MRELFKLWQTWLGIALFVLSLFFGWGLPMIMPSTPYNGIIIIVIGVAISVPLFIWAYILYRRQRSISQPLKESTEKLQNAHVIKIITDTKSEPLLALPDALHALGELDIELVNKLGQIKRSKTKLKSIQSRLQKDWGIKPPKTYKNSAEQTTRDTVNQTVKKMGISYTSVNEETMMFMLHIAGVLDDEGVGISAHRENDDRYKTVIKLQAKVATQELNNAIGVYLWYSLGINSILLFISYFPPKAVRSVLQIFGETPTELRAEREQTLRFLLTNISGLIEQELHREK